MSDLDLLVQVLEGRAAALGGEPETANPYPQNTEAHARWLVGYNQALCSAKTDETPDST